MPTRNDPLKQISGTSSLSFKKRAFSSLSTLMNPVEYVVAAADLVHSEQERNETNVAKLGKLLEDFGDLCIVCFIEFGTLCNHTLSQCPVVKNKGLCLQCMSDQHMVSACSNRPNFSLKARVCWVCGLPGEMGTMRFHDYNKIGRLCESRGKDLLIVLCWLLRRKTHHLCQEQMHLSDTEFAVWLSQTCENVSDVCECFIF